MGWDKKKACWVTTIANNHFKQSKDCNPLQHAKLSAARDAKGKAMAQRMMVAGSDKTMAVVAVPFALSPELCLTKAAKWYIYGSSRVAKATFRDEFFCDMLKSYYKCGGGIGEPPKLSIKALSKYIDAEFDCFLMYATFLAEK